MSGPARTHQSGSREGPDGGREQDMDSGQASSTSGPGYPSRTRWAGGSFHGAWIQAGSRPAELLALLISGGPVQRADRDLERRQAAEPQVGGQAGGRVAGQVVVPLAVAGQP